MVLKMIIKKNLFCEYFLFDYVNPETSSNNYISKILALFILAVERKLTQLLSESRASRMKEYTPKGKENFW